MRGVRAGLVRSVLAGAAAAVVVGVGGVGGVGGCAAPSGPTIGFRNDTDTVVKATFWAGERDPDRPGGARLRKAEELNVVPRARGQSSLTPIWHYRSAADSVVRVQLRPAVTSFEGAAEWWFELTPPGPYIVRAVRTEGGAFRFEREGRGEVTPVPQEFWVKAE